MQGGVAEKKMSVDCCGGGRRGAGLVVEVFEFAANTPARKVL